MNRNELKAELRAQRVMFDEGVQRKLHAILNDNLFAKDNETSRVSNTKQTDNNVSIEDIFNEQLNKESVNAKSDYLEQYLSDDDVLAAVELAPEPSQPEEAVEVVQSAPEPVVMSQTAVGQDAEILNKVAERKRCVAAKIAALRGITLPGDYLQNK